MSINIIDEKLKIYAANTIEDEERALKEILQEIALWPCECQFLIKLFSMVEQHCEFCMTPAVFGRSRFLIKKTKSEF